MDSSRYACLIVYTNIKLNLKVKNMMNLHKQLCAHFLLLFLIGNGFIIACSGDSDQMITNDRDDLQNTLTEAERAEGWMLMFDGETSEGWRGYNSNEFPEGWVVDDGTLHCTGKGGDVIYDQKYLDFHLKIDWMISEGGNSGIFFLAQEIEGKPIWHTAPEYQLLDNDAHPDLNPDQYAPALYDLVPPSVQNTRPAGEWNRSEIIVKDGHLTQRQNGEDVVQIRLDTPEWKAMVDESKFPVEIFGILKPGYIGVQDHGDDVWFRNIKIREL